MSINTVNGQISRTMNEKGDGMNRLPKDPVMLLSYVNTQLRDHYSSLEDFCAATGVQQEMIEASLKMIDYRYDPEKNQFK